MAKEIIWSDKAISSYFDILNYIESSFGIISAEKFISQVEETIDTIIDFPLLGKPEFKNSQIRGIIIAGKTTLYYNLEKESIQLMKFFDHRQHPDKRLI